jgi:hypothetical protein
VEWRRKNRSCDVDARKLDVGEEDATGTVQFTAPESSEMK